MSDPHHSRPPSSSSSMSHDSQVGRPGPNQEPRTQSRRPSSSRSASPMSERSQIGHPGPSQPSGQSRPPLSRSASSMSGRSRVGEPGPSQEHRDPSRPSSSGTTSAQTSQMSHLSNGLGPAVGLRLHKYCPGNLREELNEEELKQMDEEHRNEAIIKRANFYIENNNPPGIDLEKYHEAINTARRCNRYNTTGNDGRKFPYE